MHMGRGMPEITSKSTTILWILTGLEPCYCQNSSALLLNFEKRVMCGRLLECLQLLFVEVQVRWIAQLARMDQVHCKEPLRNQMAASGAVIRTELIHYPGIQEWRTRIKSRHLLHSKATLGITRANAMQIAPTAIYAVPRKSFFPLLSHKIKFPTSVEHSCTGRIYKPGPVYYLEPD